MQTLEQAILAEARTITGNSKLKMKDILEWSTGKIEEQSGEKVYNLPGIQVNIAIEKG